MTNVGFLTARLAPKEKATVKDIVFAAGFYEGDGYCEKHLDRIRINQKDRWMLDYLRRKFGGSVIFREGQNAFAWSIHDARARGFMLTIYCLLSPRRQKQIRERIEETRRYKYTKGINTN